ncbi:DUF2339 domain-containing protein [Rhizobium sp. FKY42]|uniref:DUF2339 domain-containing protein n=1 Tax=Rhizobium sp. FKY42 TaxID=2562310 RepID=UPI0010C035A1|nr:DUF2339 domain-containing protein [Rhizobium sp. FKY42]
MYELLVLVSLLALFVGQRRLTNRVHQLETELKLLKLQREAVDPVGARIHAPDQATEESEFASDEPPGEPSIAEAETEVEGATSPLPVAANSSPSESLESRLGAQWTVWVGGLALALGGVFLVRYSIEAGLLGPAARLTLATIFGLLLAAGGEMLRRGSLPRLPQAYNNAMIPGILTAAASVTLLATVFTAHAFYGFLGLTTAFVLLALVSFATLALSLLHGQALAGLGLVAGLVSPLLVSSDDPSFYVLFGYLTTVWCAATLAARIREWRILPVFANVLMMCWIMFSWGSAYILEPSALPPPPASGIALMVMIAGTAFFWPGRRFEADITEPAAERGLWRYTRRLLSRSPKAIMISISLAVMLSVLTMVAADLPTHADSVMIFVAVTGCLASLGAGRRSATIPAIFAGLTAIWGIALFALLDASRVVSSALPQTAAHGWLSSIAPEAMGGLVLGGVFTLCGCLFIRRNDRIDPEFSVLWALLASVIPLGIASITFINYGALNGDWWHAIAMLLTAGALLATALRISKSETEPAFANMPRDLFILGSFGALTLALHCLTKGLITTIGVPIIGAAYVLASARFHWRGLPWAMIAAAFVTLVRIGWEPTIVGAQNLSTTPVFNQLLAGYGVPAALLTFSAWYLRRWDGRRTLNALQGLAALMGLIAIAILVRHAMNDGVLNDAVPTLGEQSIYTLLLIGLSGILMTLDFGNPSGALRYGSILAGVLATLNALFLHLGALNPFFTDESLGTWPLVNLLLPGYLLPALAYAGLAYYARDKRPRPYVVMLAIAAAVLVFAWATLSVRWFWQGPHIAEWKGFLSAETYTYSVVWLAIGVGLLVLGSRFNARSLRLASAVLVLIAVCKAFLIDMSNLEGILRALSFIGLGGVLIGIGLFYQKVLARTAPAQDEPAA